MITKKANSAMRRRLGGKGAAIAAALFTASILSLGAPIADAQDRPNFVLIASEDNSVHFLAHFFSGGAKLPTIELLAANGITFDRTFSNSPVCSVARTSLITSVYGPRAATHHHRRLTPSTLPVGWEMFPYYLRESGYHTVKNGKKDFNAAEGDIWDREGPQAHWRSRPNKETPFFYMHTLHVTHEGRLHFKEDVVQTEPTKHDPDEVQLFPYLPDTELTRYTHAFYLDRHLDMDEQLGRMLKQLDEDGLRESTIVIYYGDHGGVLPRSKGYLYEGGLHVPLVIHIPEEFQHLSPFQPGTRVDGFVEFVDFGPTILNLAGLGLPSHMDGKPFLGPDVSAQQVAERDEAFSYADRFDEKYDLVRALRKGDFKYIRHYWAHYPDSLVNGYRYQQSAYTQWQELYRAGELNEVQKRFFEPRHPEALYDLASDPHEIRNLATDPNYAEVLEEMRGRLRQRMRAMPDLGLFPESYLLQHAVQDPLAFGQQNNARITQLLNVADLALLSFEEARSGLESALAAEDPWMRYWALTVCTVFGRKAEEIWPQARALTEDALSPVRIRGAEFLGVLGSEDAMPLLYKEFSRATNLADALLALNTITYLRDHLDYDVDPDRLEPHPGVGSSQLTRRLEYLRAGATRN